MKYFDFEVGRVDNNKQYFYITDLDDEIVISMRITNIPTTGYQFHMELKEALCNYSINNELPELIRILDNLAEFMYVKTAGTYQENYMLHFYKTIIDLFLGKG